MYNNKSFQGSLYIIRFGKTCFVQCCLKLKPSLGRVLSENKSSQGRVMSENKNFLSRVLSDDKSFQGIVMSENKNFQISL